jgi:lipopolysaccharide transport system permease protein
MSQPEDQWKNTTIIGPATEPGHASAGIFTLWKFRSLLGDFVKQDLKYRYTGGSLGFFWTVVTPLMELITYTFVFHGLIGISFHPQAGWTNYALFLFSGMVTWLAMSDGVSQASASVTNNGHLIKKVNFPVMILPTHLVSSATVNQCIRFSVLILATLVLTGNISWHILFLPFVIALQFAFTLGLGLLLSVCNVYFRDTNHWVNAILLLWMFITPIFYPAAAYPKKYILMLQLNPLAHLVGVYRELLLNQTMPHPHSIIIVAVTATLSLVVGYSVFHHHQRKFSDFI